MGPLGLGHKIIKDGGGYMVTRNHLIEIFQYYIFILMILNLDITNWTPTENDHNLIWEWVLNVNQNLIKE